MIEVAKSRFRTAIHAVPVVRGASVCPLSVTAAGMPAPARPAWSGAWPAGTGCLTLRRADTLARAGPPAATMTGRKPD